MSFKQNLAVQTKRHTLRLALVTAKNYAVVTSVPIGLSRFACTRGGHSGTYYRYVRDRGQDAVKRSK